VTASLTTTDDARLSAGSRLQKPMYALFAYVTSLEASEPLPGIAAYHCQQAAEKVVKCMLVMAGIPFAKTHDMARLGDLAASSYADCRHLLAEMGQLTVWGYAYR
jgi:hypothetical protein